ncbi:MAG: nucleotidyltransferase domain-containing protein [Elusimicrobia bacterium]|nr:nucleotidyltransferase domain-containing protein [Candidatus Liberimonas magnetica]
MKLNFNIFKSLITEKHILNKYHLRRIGIFGSFIKAKKAKDIDVLIEDSINYKNALSLKEELEKITNKKIDMVIEKYANPIILYRARKEAIYVEKH